MPCTCLACLWVLGPWWVLILSPFQCVLRAQTLGLTCSPGPSLRENCFCLMSISFFCQAAAQSRRPQEAYPITRQDHLGPSSLQGWTVLSPIPAACGQVQAQGSASPGGFHGRFNGQNGTSREWEKEVSHSPHNTHILSTWPQRRNRKVAPQCIHLCHTDTTPVSSTHSHRSSPHQWNPWSVQG